MRNRTAASMRFLVLACGALLAIGVLHAEDDQVRRVLSELGQADATAQPDHIDRWRAVLSKSATIPGEGAEVWTVMTGVLKSPMRVLAEGQVLMMLSLQLPGAQVAGARFRADLIKVHLKALADGSFKPDVAPWVMDPGSSLSVVMGLWRGSSRPQDQQAFVAEAPALVPALVEALGALKPDHPSRTGLITLTAQLFSQLPPGSSTELGKAFAARLGDDRDVLEVASAWRGAVPDALAEKVLAAWDRAPAQRSRPQVRALLACRADRRCAERALAWVLEDPARSVQEREFEELLGRGSLGPQALASWRAAAFQGLAAQAERDPRLGLAVALCMRADLAASGKPTDQERAQLAQALERNDQVRPVAAILLAAALADDDQPATELERLATQAVAGVLRLGADGRLNEGGTSALAVLGMLRKPASDPARLKAQFAQGKLIPTSTRRQLELLLSGAIAPVDDGSQSKAGAAETEPRRLGGLLADPAWNDGPRAVAKLPADVPAELVDGIVNGILARHDRTRFADALRPLLSREWARSAGQDRRLALAAAQAAVCGDQAKAKAWLGEITLPPVNPPGARTTMVAFTRTLDLLSLIDPQHARVQSTKAGWHQSAASDPAAQVSLWLLAVRTRTTDVKFPRDAYRGLSASEGLTDVSYQIARMAGELAPHLDRLADPKAALPKPLVPAGNAIRLAEAVALVRRVAGLVKPAGN